MKKIIVLTAALLLSLAVSAEESKGSLGFGGAMFLKSPVFVGQPIDADKVNVNQFDFGADARFKLDWFQAESLAMFSFGDVNGMNIFLDAGVGLDISLISFSLGVGPNFFWNFNAKPPVQTGINAKVGGDIRLDDMSVGFSYIMSLVNDDGVSINTGSGLLGVQVLFWQ
jgi:hypothetical protein